MNVLLIGNDASRTGAPLVLLHLLEWLQAQADIRCDVLLRKGGGPLQGDFARLAPVTCYDTLVSDRGLVRRVARRLGVAALGGTQALSTVERLYHARGIDVVFANTITQGGILSDLAALRLPVIAYVHELDSMIRQYGDTNFMQVSRCATRWVAGSRQVAANLAARGINPGLVDTVPGFISAVALERRPANPAAVRARWNIPAETFLVLGSGFRNWRKGKDLFIQLALAVRRAACSRPIRFLWVGGRDGDDEWYQASHDVAHAGLQDIVRLVPEVDNHADYSAACDALATVSREDPFPLTNLEAGYYGKPVLCFADAGGSPEYVEEDAGFVVPYLDVAAMAEKIVLLATDPAQCRRLGVRAARKVRERHEVQIAGPLLLSILRNACAPARSHQ